MCEFDQCCKNCIDLCRIINELCERNEVFMTASPVAVCGNLHMAHMSSS